MKIDCYVSGNTFKEVDPPGTLRSSIKLNTFNHEKFQLEYTLTADVGDYNKRTYIYTLGIEKMFILPISHNSLVSKQNHIQHCVTSRVK